MNYKDFKGLNISTLGMGNMRLPVGEGGIIDEERAQAMIDRAIEAGINYFDTGYRYHGGQSELFVGRALNKHPREKWYIASKMPGHMMDYIDGKLSFKGYLSGSTVKHVSEIFEDQLKRCQVDYFDFYLLHNVSETSIGFYTNEEVGVVEYLLEQKKAGRIRHLGFSAHGGVECIRNFLDKYDCFEFCQIQLNYLDWTLQDAKAKYELLAERGVALIVMEPVRGGKLVNLPDEAKAILEKADPSITPARWALRFLQTLPHVQVVLSGMSSMEQLDDNIELFNDPMPLDEPRMEALQQAVRVMLDAIPCTACRYCTEVCPQGLDIPGLISMYNGAKHDGLGGIQFALGALKQDDLPTACIGCGACSGVCPQNIDVPNVLKKFSAML